MSEPRTSHPIVPREHGAWAVLFGSFLAGVGVAGRVTPAVILLLGGVILLTLANGPFTALFRRSGGRPSRAESRCALSWLLAYGSGAAACLAPLIGLYRMAFLLPFGLVAALFLVLRAFLVPRGKDRSLFGELVGVAGLTLSGPAAQAVAVDGIPPACALLWLLLFLFFVSGVFYVRMRIRVVLARRRGMIGATNPARRWCFVYHLMLLVVIPALAATQLIPWLVLLAFVPAVWRAAAGIRRQEVALNLKRLGWSEVGLAAAFVALLVFTF